MMLAHNKVYFGDCLDVMEEIPSGTVDMILADLPYGVTRNKWDSVIPLGSLWRSYLRVIKPKGVIVLHGQDKFSARLMLSNPAMHRYNLIWEKTTPTGHLNAKKAPLRSHEDILVFYNGTPTYNPQKTTGHPRKVSSAHHKRNSAKTTNYNSHGLSSYDSTERYPKSVLKFKTDKQTNTSHPTQKPVALEEYLIRTYSNPGELILDNCGGSGTTGIAAINAGRDFIIIEKDLGHFKTAESRISQAIAATTITDKP